MKDWLYDKVLCSSLVMNTIIFLWILFMNLLYFSVF